MQDFLELVICEIKLYIRSKSFWLLGLLAIGSISLPTINVLLLQFLIAGAIVRDRRTHFAAILVSLPYSSMRVYLARALSLLIMLFGLWPFMVVVVGILPDFVPAEWLFSYSAVGFLTLKYMMTCATSIGFVFLLGEIARKSIWIYLLISICWEMGHNLASNLSYYPIWSQLLLFGHGIMLPGAPSLMVGYFPQQELLGYVTIVQLALAIAFFEIAVLLQCVRRGEAFWRSRFIMTLLMLAVISGVWAGIAAWHELDHRERDARLALAESQALFNPMDRHSVTPKLEQYNLAVQLQTNTHRLEGTARLQLAVIDVSTDSIVFTLRNYFQVINVTIGDQQEPLEWSRDGSRLFVQLPERYRQGKSFTVNIDYSGEVWEGFHDRMACPTGPVNFIAADFSLLRSGYGWYPIPGEQSLYERKSSLEDAGNSLKPILRAKLARHDAVPFDLTVDIDTNSTVGSNLEFIGQQGLTGLYKQRYYFQSDFGKDVALFSGPYQYEKKLLPGRKDPVAVYYYSRHQDKVDHILSLVSQPYQFVETLLEPAIAGPASYRQGMSTLVEMPSLFFCTVDGTAVKSLLMTDTILLSENLFRNNHWPLVTLAKIRQNKLTMAVLQRWWQADISGALNKNQPGNVQESLMLYLYVLYSDQMQQSGFYEQVKQNLLTGEKTESGPGDFTRPVLVDGAIVRDVFLTLDDIRQLDQGTSLFATVMQQLYAVAVQQGAISSADFSRVIESVLAREKESTEQTKKIRLRLTRIVQQENADAAQPLAIEKSLTVFAFNLEDWLP